MQIHGFVNLYGCEIGDDVKIGERVAGGSILFQGNIDEVRIWDIARTEAEIQSTMNTGVCEDAAGLQAYFNYKKQK